MDRVSPFATPGKVPRLGSFSYYADPADKRDHLWSPILLRTFWWQARTGKKFIYMFPRHTLCWVQLAGMLVRAPCDTQAFVAANYGADWRTPVQEWDWKRSPPNVAPYGQWPPDTWPRTIQCDVCPNQVNLNIPYT